MPQTALENEAVEEEVVETPEVAEEEKEFYDEKYWRLK